MDRYSGGNTVLHAGTFALPAISLGIMSAWCGDVLYYQSNLFEACLLWIVGLLVSYLLIIIHESGHLLAARVAGIQIESITIGHWRKLASFTLGSLKVVLRAAPASGYVIPQPTAKRSSTAGLCLFVLGGVLAEGIVVALAIAMPTPSPIVSFGEVLCLSGRTSFGWG
ncbi:MAG: site-2 protease family protein [Opitutaceae bacterium]